MSSILPYCNLFPTVVSDIFYQSTENSCVRHSLLSLSSMISDYRLQRPLDRFQYQYIKTLQLIQRSLLKTEVTESIAIAVYLMLCIDTVRADLDTARKHLRGLFLILQQLQEKPVLCMNGDYGPITKVVIY
jgi:Fungal specific transcription factor domain